MDEWNINETLSSLREEIEGLYSEAVETDSPLFGIINLFETLDRHMRRGGEMPQDWSLNGLRN